MAKARIIDRDQGAKKLAARLRSGGASLTVGIHEDDGGDVHPSSDLTIAEIGAVHEFGAPVVNVPERSFLRSFVDENESKIRKSQKRIAEMVVQGQLPSIEAGLDRLGLTLVGQIQENIRAGIPPELQPKTVARKGSSVPLIDTAAMISAITHRVEPAK